MQQVARAAGVSLKTVSRVVNSEPGVSSALSERVRIAVGELGYRHNRAASDLRRGVHTSQIGVLVQDLGNDYSGQLLRAVEDRARLREVVVISASLDEEPERELSLVGQLIERRIDGLILMPTADSQDYLLQEIASGLKVVVVDRPTMTPLDSVVVDNQVGAQRATEHLIRHGHRLIGYLGDADTIATATHRFAGFRAALAAAKIEPTPKFERLGVRTDEDAQRVVRGWLATQEQPTGIVAARNVLTIGVVRALRDLDRRHDVALVGFDDFPTADLLDPGVTTIVQDVAEIGRSAIDMLLARLDGDIGEVRQIVVPTRLVTRGSGEIPGPGV